MARYDTGLSGEIVLMLFRTYPSTFVKDLADLYKTALLYTFFFMQVINVISIRDITLCFSSFS
jgi:hypothetical protein